MIDLFKVSVVIPVYNSAEYLVKAVESAVHLDEVGEILLVEDKSPDNALEICRHLVEKYPIVKLLQHPNGENKGPAESRNIGMKNATCDYISFLDSDDYYLENRFFTAKRVFKEQPDADGVYDAIGFFKGSSDFYKLYTINKPIDPDCLFHFLLRGTFGHFSTNGITLKKKLIQKVGYFDPKLKQHEDSELWLRFAFFGKLYPGNLKEPVALARMHDKNTSINADAVSKLQYAEAIIARFKKEKVSFVNRLLIRHKYAKAMAELRQSLYLKELLFSFLRKYIK